MALLDQLKALVNQIDDNPPKCASPACAVPCCDPPYVQCCMTCPPPIMAPTAPKYVKPLQLPCPEGPARPIKMSQAEAERTRYANYYNNYNIDWHPDSERVRRKKNKGPAPPQKRPKKYCQDHQTQMSDCEPKKAPGCPTGYKPCRMELKPYCGDVLTAKVHACSPKPRKKYSCFYVPGPCCRPGCKHWKSKEGECKYDNPCKAHCYNHPPGMKPTKNN